MADYEAAPEGGIKEAGAEQSVPVPAAEEVKTPAEAAPESEAEKTEEESTDTEKPEEVEESPAGEEKTED